MRAAFAPLIALAGCLLFTWLFYMAAGELASGGEADIRGRHQFMKQIAVWVTGLLGPTGVLIAGGLATLIAGAWFRARVKTPPRMLTLARG